MAVGRVQYDLDETVMNPHKRIRRAANMVTKHPILCGMLLSLPIAGAVIILGTWFPGVEVAMGRHGALLDSMYYTGGLWGAFIYYFWSLRHAPNFWAMLGGLFVLHVGGIYCYTVYVHPLLVWQWALLIFLEGEALTLILGWRVSRGSEGGGTGSAA